VNDRFGDCKESFEEELDIILLYVLNFKSPPFTLQRICELLLDPERHYRSAKRLLYAFEKLVNVSDYDER
jgi:serine/threonine-protein phosphatase 4 regulatory subunit 2